MLAVNFDEMIRVVVSFIIGIPVPMTAIQILRINLVTDSFPALWLGFDRGDGDVMSQKPRDPKQGILQWQRFIIIIASILASALGIGLFIYNLQTEWLEIARTVSVTAAVFFEMMVIYSFRHPTKQAWQLPTNRFLNWSVIGVLCFHTLTLYMPWWKYFDFVPLSWEDLWLCFMTGMIWWIVFEWWKWIKKKTSN